MAQNVIPLVVVISPNNPAPGSTVTVTVTLQPPSVSGSLTITSVPTGFFSGFPSSISVPALSTQVTFSAQVSSSVSGEGKIRADGGLGASEGSCDVAVTE